MSSTAQIHGSDLTHWSPNVQVANPVFSFPLEDYAAQGHDLIINGKWRRVLAGDAWGDIVSWSNQQTTAIGCKPSSMS